MLARGVPARLELGHRAPRPRRACGSARPSRPTSARPARGRRRASTRSSSPRRRGRHELPAGRRPARRARSASPRGSPRRAATPRSPCTPTCRPPAGSRSPSRQGRFRDQGVSARGPLGLGTEFESVRDYLPDDDIRQVNWRATARLGRPMSNQYRIEQDRDVMCVVDAGRLMAAPLPAPAGASPDAARRGLDALTAVALRRRRGRGPLRRHRLRRARSACAIRPGRARATAVVRAVFDLEPRPVDADYELAFRRVGGRKRAFVLVLTDLLEEAAARPLVDAMPVLTRRHAVVVASPADPPSRRSPRARRSGDGRPRPRRRRRRRAGAPRTRAAALVARPPAPRSSRRPPTASPAPASPPTCAPRPEPGCEARGAPATPRGPRTAPRARRRSPLHRERELGPVRNPSANPHSTSHGAVPSTSSTARRASLTSARPRRSGPGRDERPSDPQPRRAAHDDARQLERSVGGHQAQERGAVARADGQPADDPERSAR